MPELVTIKSLLLAAFNAGMIWGGIRTGQKSMRERQIRHGREITRLRQYKAWSHRALSMLIGYHRSHHPNEYVIDDWKEIEEGTNGGSDGNTE